MQGESTPNGPPIRVVALLGSLRRASLNGALLRAAREAAPAGMRIEPFALAGVPFYDGDVETDGEPEAVISLKGVISAADALLLVTPEYNRGLPAVIKNAIDWASRPPFGSPLVGKPVLLMGATTGRSAVKYALQDAAEALDYAQAKPYETRYGVPRAGDLIDGDGRLADARIHAELRELLSAFETAVRRTTVPTQHLAA
jgi:NAD(P)H-dependent FMN reductase